MVKLGKPQKTVIFVNGIAIKRGEGGKALTMKKKLFFGAFILFVEKNSDCH